MSEIREKRCFFCKKTLLDDERFICHRCFLKTRNRAVTAISIVLGASFIARGGKEIYDDYSESKEKKEKKKRE